MNRGFLIATLAACALTFAIVWFAIGPSRAVAPSVAVAGPDATSVAPGLAPDRPPPPPAAPFTMGTPDPRPIDPSAPEAQIQLQPDGHRIYR